MGIVLVLISSILGYCLIKRFLRCKSIILILFGSYLTGTVISGILLYLLDLFFIFFFDNYFLGIAAYITLSLGYIGYAAVKYQIMEKLFGDFISFSADPWTISILMLALIFSLWLNYSTFYLDNGDIVTTGAWYDILYHHSYVRTVSIGKNMPVQYPYFANSSHPYHFMFDYFTGKMALLKLHSVHALNIMSVMGMTSLLLLIFEFGSAYLKSKAAGAIGAVLFLF